MTPSEAQPPAIERDQLLPLFAAAMPSFLPIWHSFLNERKDERDLPLYRALSDLAHHLIDQLADGDVSDFPRVFELVECCQVSGDAYVQEAVTIGLLEDLQNLNLHSTTTPADFEVWLHPRSKVMWRSLIRFWSGQSAFVGSDVTDA